MTTPKVPTIKREGSRFYVHPETKAKAPGVTSIVGMLPKGFLKYYAARVAAGFAVEHLGEIVGLALRDPDAARDLIYREPDRDTKRAADLGSEVHSVFEALARGEDVRRLHPEIQPYADHFREFLDQEQPEFVHLEETVWSEKHDYAGSFDALMRIRGELVFGDWKTNRSDVHTDVGLQLSGYRYADYIVRPDGTRLPVPEVSGGCVLHVRPEGWKLCPIRCDEEVFQYFLHLRGVFDWVHGVQKTVIGKPIAGSDLRRTRRSVRRSA